nr:hypothetical protein [Paracoccaceae bacterium]
MRRRSEAEAAAREAYEEAGVRGEIADRSLGLFSYEKGIGNGRVLTRFMQQGALSVWKGCVIGY